MPNYGYAKGVRPLWLSRFLGHKWQTICVAIALCAIPIYTCKWQHLSGAAGALLGLLMSPDLDLSWSRLGWFGKLSLADEYTALVPHRAKISHTVLLGTLVRAPVVFLPIVVCVAAPVVAIIRKRLGIDIRVPWLMLAQAFVGLAMADAWHIACDKIEGSLKMKRRRR